jgi:hypothetical protein
MISRRAITGNRVYRESYNLGFVQNEIRLLLGNDDDKVKMAFEQLAHTR